MRLLSARQFREWQEYYQAEPFGDSLLDMRLADQACMFANANRDSKKHPEPFTIGDFAPYLAADKPVEKTVDLGPEENAKLIRQQIEAMRKP